MPRFAVDTESLCSAASVLTGASELPKLSDVSAAAGTPAAAAWAALVSDADRVLSNSTQVRTDLGVALRAAASAYALADAASASGYRRAGASGG